MSANLTPQEPAPSKGYRPGAGVGLADLCISRPVLATMLNLLLVALGIMSFQKLGVDSMPNVELPIVTVTTTLRGASPEEMETTVTKPIEEIVNTIQGVDEIASSTREGVSRVTVQFLLSRDRDSATQDVRDKVNTILARLPEGTEPPILDKFDIDAAPIMSISVSGDRDLREITQIADKTIRQSLETVPDVGAVNLVGARYRALQVAVDLDRLRARGLSIDQVRAALLRQNVELPEGRAEHGKRELGVRILGRIARPSEFGDIIVANTRGQPVYLREIATVTDSVEDPRSLSLAEGRNNVTLVVRKQSGVNTVAVCESLTAKLAQLQDVVPQGIRLSVVRDQSTFITASLHELSFHLVLGAVLVAITVFAFLHDWRGTVIASVAIPASIVATFSLMRLLGYTLNNFTMLGLVFAVGIVIDDAIVVLENIHRTMEERGWSAERAAREATREIAMAVVATTLSLVVIFLPLAFMGGRVGRFFSSYGVTVAFALMVSLFISFTLTPMLASRFLRASQDPAVREKKAHGGPLLRWLGGHYTRILAWSLRHRWSVVLATGVCLGSLLWLVPATRFTYFPQDDTGDFEVAFILPPGSNLAVTEGVARDIDARLRAITLDGAPAVVSTVITIGDSSGRVGKGEGNVAQAVIYCRLPPLGGLWSRLTKQSRGWSQFDAMAKARRILVDFPDVRASVQGIGNQGAGGGRNAEFQFNLVGPDLDKLLEYSAEMVRRMQQIQGLADVDTTMSARKPELQMTIDRAKASQFGLQVADIASALNTLVGGEIAGSYKEQDEQYDVWLRAMPGQRSTAESLGRITLTPRGEVLGPANASAGVAGSGKAMEGLQVPLSNFVTIREALGPNQIDRFQRQRRITVQANLAGIGLGEAMTRVRDLFQSMNLPVEYSMYFTGRAKSFAESNQNFLIAFLVAMVFMYMILAGQFEHFVHPVSILLAVPLSLPFALLPFVLAREQLNIYGVFGLFMLFGVIKKNGILQIDYTNTLRARGMDRESAILEANRVRLRPILMTTMILVASMIPIAVGKGPGAAGRAAMAKVIINGQLLCLLLTLLVTPVTYAIFDDWGAGRFWKRKARSAA